MTLPDRISPGMISSPFASAGVEYPGCEVPVSRHSSSPGTPAGP